MMNAKGGDAAVFASLLANEVSVNGENTSQVFHTKILNNLLLSYQEKNLVDSKETKRS